MIHVKVAGVKEKLLENLYIKYGEGRRKIISIPVQLDTGMFGMPVPPEWLVSVGGWFPKIQEF